MVVSGACGVQFLMAKACGVARRAANVLPVNLEDHLGDIIRKARMMSNVSASAAAGAAGISETELSALEESGKTAPSQAGSVTRGGPAQKHTNRFIERTAKRP